MFQDRIGYYTESIIFFDRISLPKIMFPPIDYMLTNMLFNVLFPGIYSFVFNLPVDSTQHIQPT